MLSLLKYCPPPNRAKVVAWLTLPLLYFVLPDEGIMIDGYRVSRLTAAVSLHLPFLLVVSLVNLLRHEARRDRMVMVSIIALSLLIVLNVAAILIATDSVLAAKHVLSVQAAAFVAFHLWAISFPDFLRDYYAWPWAGLPKGIGIAGAIRGGGHLAVLIANEALIRWSVPDHFWVIGAAVLPVLAVILADIVTVFVLFALGMRPRGYGADDPVGAEDQNGGENGGKDGDDEGANPGLGEERRQTR